MANLRSKPSWEIPERHVTPEKFFWNRRQFLRQLGFASSATLGAFVAGCDGAKPEAVAAPKPGAKPSEDPNASTVALSKYPAARNPEFNIPGRVTDQKEAATYNNFYEFTTLKNGVNRLTHGFTIAPWQVEVSGLVEKPLRLDAEELISMMPLEERVYRFRCVEAWAMIVPWTGFPLAKLLEKVQPKPEAKFVRFVSFNRPDQAPGMRDTSYPWPYTEGLRLDEAMNPLTLVGAGIYGKPLPKQHGAPLRMVVPWKYGYKSIKSIVKIELVEKQPATLWETLAPDEYPFESNVNPAVPHPRWSQATERLIDSGDRVRTQLYNGYGSYVAKLYGGNKG